jgi:hypothetical protein
MSIDTWQSGFSIKIAGLFRKNRIQIVSHGQSPERQAAL